MFQVIHLIRDLIFFEYEVLNKLELIKAHEKSGQGLIENTAKK